MAAYGYHHVPPSQINEMVKRLSRPTRASRTWNSSYEAQQAHVAHLRLEDPYFQRNRTVPSKELDPILQRLQKRTQASTASKYNYDNQEANWMHPYLRDPKMQIGRSPGLVWVTAQVGPHQDSMMTETPCHLVGNHREVIEDDPSVVRAL